MPLLEVTRLWELSLNERRQLLVRSGLEVDRCLPEIQKILAEVRKRGDPALLEYTSRFDGVRLSAKQLRVSKGEIRAAYGCLDKKLIGALRRAAKNIERFHRRQVPKEWMVELKPGVKAGQLVRPLRSVGAYVPGGRARYPSTVLMAAIPARVAGVRQLIMCTPPRPDGGVDPATLVAGDISGVDEVFRVGGAQAIAAMAYGTQTIPKVDKVVGPGNIYVTAAKLLVATEVDIDFPAGPSEILIIADDSADPRCVAIELIAQAEHDPSAAAVLVTTSEKLASEAHDWIAEALKEIPRAELIREALSKYGHIILTRNLGEAVEFANEYAPEHLRLLVRKPKSLLKSIENAGAVFIGPWTPIATGDYGVGPNHILPTGGVAKRKAGLSALDFIRSPTVQMLNERGLKSVASVVKKLAEVEGLHAHCQSVLELLKNSPSSDTND